jgi:hypothetical protein
MKDYVNKHMKGFRFGSGTTGVRYHSSMNKNLGKIGKIIGQDSISVKVRFDNNVCFYPISVAQHHITTEKEYQKSKLIEIMKGDEELGLYEQEIEKQSIHYANNYFDMFETNSYKTLRKGFEAGAKWAIAQQNKK